MSEKNTHLPSLISFLQRKGFVWGPEPEIYGGTAGFYTYAPLGKLLKNRVENTIRQTLSAESFFEVECPIIMERRVWEASGHLGGFTDPVIKDANGGFHRVDKLIENWTAHHSAKASLAPHFHKGTDEEKMQVISFIKEHKILSPDGVKLIAEKPSDIQRHNLMMQTEIGAGQEAYNRPETATTTYLPFPRYTDYFRKNPVFGVFQIGKAFRNEISPRQHILRMREFTQAEAQLFIKKELKNNFEKYERVKNEILPFWDYDSQENEGGIQFLTLAEALEKGFVKSQAYVWSLNLAYKLFKNLGIPEENIRLRQHFPDEKAFYADDAWDVEINTKSFGWIEACGVHDRTDYDLTQHSKFSGQELLSYDEATKEKYVPHIIEIAFGSDRPVFAVLDNFYDQKAEGEGKTTFRIPYKMSPIPVAVFPLMKKPELISVASRVFDSLKNEFVCVYDEAGAIGRRYLRAAEAGTAYCLTVDYDSVQDETVTIRDRDTEAQKRVAIANLRDTIRKLLNGEMSFEEL